MFTESSFLNPNPIEKFQIRIERDIYRLIIMFRIMSIKWLEEEKLHEKYYKNWIKKVDPPKEKYYESWKLLTIKQVLLMGALTIVECAEESTDESIILKYIHNMEFYFGSFLPDATIKNIYNEIAKNKNSNNFNNYFIQKILNAYDQDNIEILDTTIKSLLQLKEEKFEQPACAIAYLFPMFVIGKKGKIKDIIEYFDPYEILLSDKKLNQELDYYLVVKEQINFYSKNEISQADALVNIYLWVQHQSRIDKDHTRKKMYLEIISRFEQDIVYRAQQADPIANKIFGFIMLKKLDDNEDYSSKVDYENKFHNHYNSKVKTRHEQILNTINDQPDKDSIKQLQQSHREVQRIHQTMQNIAPKIFSYTQLKTDFLFTDILNQFSKYFVECQETKHGIKKHGISRIKQIHQFFSVNNNDGGNSDLFDRDNFIDKISELEKALVVEDKNSKWFRSANDSKLYKLTINAIEKIHKYSPNDENISQIYNRAMEHKKILSSHWLKWTFNRNKLSAQLNR